MTTSTATLNIFSPGAMASGRDAFENTMQKVTKREVRAFLAWVGTMALDRGFSLTSGEVKARWDDVALAMAGPVADLLGQPRPTLGSLVLDTDLRAQAMRLRALPLPDLAFSSARAVLAEGGSPSAMHEAMALTSSTTQLTAGLGVIGMMWSSLVQRYARLESTIGFNLRVMREALKVRGEVAGLMWVAHHDQWTRPTHLAADGERVKIGSLFEVGTAHLTMPGDPAGPAGETINCRCALVAVRSLV